MKYSAFSYTLSLVLVGLFRQSVHGFQPIGTLSSPASASIPAFHKDSNIALCSSLIDPEEQEPEEPSIASKAAKNPTLKKIREVNDKFWDYTVNFFYVAMTAGILLNISGFAYKVSLNEGLTIQTITERRQELQWQKEMRRYEHASAMKHQDLLEKSQNL